MSKVFDEEMDIKVNKTDTFRVYVSRPEDKKEKRLIFLLHGAGCVFDNVVSDRKGLRRRATS